MLILHPLQNKGIDISEEQLVHVYIEANMDRDDPASGGVVR